MLIETIIRFVRLCAENTIVFVQESVHTKLLDMKNNNNPSTAKPDIIDSQK